jgi:hypothetical protein
VAHSSPPDFLMAMLCIATPPKRAAFPNGERSASKPGSNAKHWNQTRLSDFRSATLYYNFSDNIYYSVK